MPSKKPKNKKIKYTKTLDSRKMVSLGFLVVGVLLLSTLSIYRFIQIRRLSFNTKNSISIDQQRSPSHIKIEKFHISSSIVPAGIRDGVWDIDKENANFLISSNNPGEGGNIVIYGHNSTNVFGPLRWMEGREEIIITDQDGVDHIYIVEKIIETDAGDIQWILPKEEEILTLYTCSGFLNQKRHVIIAKPISK